MLSPEEFAARMARLDEWSRREGRLLSEYEEAILEIGIAGDPLDEDWTWNFVLLGHLLFYDYEKNRDWVSILALANLCLRANERQICVPFMRENTLQQGVLESLMKVLARNGLIEIGRIEIPGGGDLAVAAYQPTIDLDRFIEKYASGAPLIRRRRAALEAVFGPAGGTVNRITDQ